MTLATITLVSLIGILLAVAGAYFLIFERAILIGIVCLIIGLAIIGGDIGLH
jgi:hypothetical protein